MGYHSMSDYIVSEFPLKHQSWIYRELSAGEVEKKIDPDSPTGIMPESHARALTDTGLKDERDLQTASYLAADAAQVMGQPLAAKHYKAGAETVLEIARTKGNVTIEDKTLPVLKAGKVSIATLSTVNKVLEATERQKTYQGSIKSTEKILTLDGTFQDVLEQLTQHLKANPDQCNIPVKVNFYGPKKTP